MADKDLQKTGPEQFNFAPKEINKNPLDKDEEKLHETKINVGLEAGEILESEEVTSGEVSERNQGKKEGDHGGNSGSKQQNQRKYELRIPQVRVMKKDLKKELQGEIKFLKNKIDQVMKKGGAIDAHNLNKLMARLRQLKEVLASLAHGAVDTIKDLWIKFVHERRQRRKKS